MEQQITVGRIVHYHTEDGRNFAAIVVNITEGATGVDLAIFNPDTESVVFTKNVLKGSEAAQWDYPVRV